MSLRYPLYSLATPVGRRRRRHPPGRRRRGFRGNSLRLVDLAATPDDRTACPTSTGGASLTVDASAVRSFGAARSSSASPPATSSTGAAPTCCPTFPVTPRRRQLFLSAVGADRRAAVGAVPALRDVHAPLPRAARSRTPSTCARTGGSGRSLRACVSARGCPRSAPTFARSASAWRRAIAVGAGGRLHVAVRERGGAPAAGRRALDRSGRQRDRSTRRRPLIGPVVPDRRRRPGRFEAGQHHEHAVRAGRGERVARLRRSTSSSGRRRWSAHIEIRTAPVLGDLLPAHRRRAVLRRRRRRAVVRRSGACATTSGSACAG